ncbi:hypothetical protein [Stutzerimonas sp. VN223-3]
MRICRRPFPHKATTRWEDIVELKSMFPLLKVVENYRWVEQAAT